MIKFLMTMLLAAASLPGFAALQVFATVPEWGALAREIGGDKVSVFTATTALQDPHRIQARPSLLAQARRADLVVATGADLEVGWLPLVIRDSGNANIQPGRPGYFEAARFVTMLDVPVVLDRSQGDMHAAGNPHIQLDPRNLFRIGEALAIRLGELDPPNAQAYLAGYKAFAAQVAGGHRALGKGGAAAARRAGTRAPRLVHLPGELARLQDRWNAGAEAGNRTDQRPAFRPGRAPAECAGENGVAHRLSERRAQPVDCRKGRHPGGHVAVHCRRDA